MLTLMTHVLREFCSESQRMHCRPARCIEQSDVERMKAETPHLVLVSWAEAQVSDGAVDAVLSPTQRWQG